jgi:DNA-binding transcriptional LysR family regulator
LIAPWIGAGGRAAATAVEPQLASLEARKIDLGFVGLRPSAASKNMAAMAWECVARHNVVVVLPAHHPLAKASRIRMTELKPLFFVAMLPALTSIPGGYRRRANKVLAGFIVARENVRR